VATVYRTTEGMQVIRAWCESRLSNWDHPHRAQVVPTVFGPTHVVTAGNGPQLVLLPGTNFAAATWLDLVASLATSHTVHAVDLPGQPGLSAADRPARGDGRQDRWLTEVLSRLSAERSVVVAHSLGAVAAMRAVAAGLRPRRLVLVDPAGLMRLRVSMDVMRPTVRWLRKPDPVTSEALLTMMMADERRPGAELVSWMSLVGLHVRTSLAPSPLPRHVLRSLTDTPIEVISGEDDIFLPAGRLRRAVRRRLPGTNLEIVAGAGHLLPHERPDALGELLENGASA
jgi:pimeloyl-ACP methyl ester carboxylesterase